MVIETTEDLCNQLADWIGVYGACKSECQEHCENDNPLCCRVGFMIHMKDRIMEAVKNDEMIEQFLTNKP